LHPEPDALDGRSQTSTRRGANLRLFAARRVSHIGNDHRTACRYVFLSAFYVTDTPPAERRICAMCSGVEIEACTGCGSTRPS
jgi:hypothetical protein